MPFLQKPCLRRAKKRKRRRFATEKAEAHQVLSHLHISSRSGINHRDDAFHACAQHAVHDGHPRSRQQALLQALAQCVLPPVWPTVKSEVKAVPASGSHLPKRENAVVRRRHGALLQQPVYPIHLLLDMASPQLHFACLHRILKPTCVVRLLPSKWRSWDLWWQEALFEVTAFCVWLHSSGAVSLCNASHCNRTACPG